MAHNSFKSHSEDVFSVNGITHLRSVLYHTQSNEKIERFVDTPKIALLKGGDKVKSSQVITKFCTAYRTTPRRKVLYQSHVLKKY